MPLLTILILAIVQGLTEFLPISSSGHLVLAEKLLPSGDMDQWDSHMGINVAVHIGTLFSVLLYFRKDVVAMLNGLMKVTSDRNHQDTKLLGYVLIGSIPVILAGLAIHIMEPSWMLSLQIIAWTTLIFGILLWIVDVKCAATKTLEHLSLRDSVLIGLAQSFALIPGTSRSGVTMTAARALGYTRSESAHFSLLLAMVAIAGAGTLGIVHLIKDGSLELGLNMLLAALFAFVAGYAAIAVMMKWLENRSFTIFSVYRVILGLVLLGFIYL